MREMARFDVSMKTVMIMISVCNVPDLMEERVHEVLSPIWIRERHVVDKNILHLVWEECPRQDLFIFVALLRLVLFDQEVGTSLVGGGRDVDAETNVVPLLGCCLEGISDIPAVKLTL